MHVFGLLIDLVLADHVSAGHVLFVFGGGRAVADGGAVVALGDYWGGLVGEALGLGVGHWSVGLVGLGGVVV